MTGVKKKLHRLRLETNGGQSLLAIKISQVNQVLWLHILLFFSSHCSFTAHLHAQIIQSSTSYSACNFLRPRTANRSGREGTVNV